MGRRKLEQHRDPAEYRDHRWESTALVCPKCKGVCRVLVTPTRGNPRGMECTECNWSQYPGHKPTIDGPLSRTPDGGPEAQTALDAPGAKKNQRKGKHARRTDNDE